VKGEFKRINFFKGFFTQAEDWQADQTYHLDKRSLHNRHLHTPGIVHGSLNDLKVMAGDDGSSVYVAPGSALDGEGRDLYLPKPERVRVAPQTYDLPGTIYIIIRYGEEKVDLRTNAANPEYSGYAFTQERPVVEAVTDEPDNRQVIELARLSLAVDTIKIKDAKDKNDPDPGEIDLRYRLRAGAVKGPVKLEDFGEIVRKGKIGVAASRKQTPSADDTNVLIQKVKAKEQQPFYLVNAHPTAAGRVSWRIESTFVRGNVEYRLYFTNMRNTDAHVAYRVYRLN